MTSTSTFPSSEVNADHATLQGKEMQARGVPINDAETVAMTVAHIMGLGQKANGSGYLIQANRIQELEGGIAKTRQQWMGKEMLELFRGGRTAPLFPNKL